MVVHRADQATLLPELTHRPAPTPRGLPLVSTRARAIVELLQVDVADALPGDRSRHLRSRAGRGVRLRSAPETCRTSSLCGLCSTVGFGLSSHYKPATGGLPCSCDLPSLLLLTSALIVGVAGLPATAAAARPHYVAGAAGVGDPYYPLYGNGGHDVQHYRLKIAYDPGSDRLAGVATISARTAEGLYRFNLDLQGLKVRSVVVDGAGARWSRSDDHELIVTPQRPLAKGSALHHRRALRRGPPHPDDSWLRHRVRVHPHRRRCPDRGRARGGRQLVPRQRSSAGQGVLRIRGNGPGRLAGDRQRPSRRSPHESREHDLDVGGP
jgi:hypothetical protein